MSLIDLHVGMAGGGDGDGDGDGGGGGGGVGGGGDDDYASQCVLDVCALWLEHWPVNGSNALHASELCTRSASTLITPLTPILKLVPTNDQADAASTGGGAVRRMLLDGHGQSLECLAYYSLLVEAAMR